MRPGSRLRALPGAGVPRSQRHVLGPDAGVTGRDAGAGVQADQALRADRHGRQSIVALYHSCGHDRLDAHEAGDVRAGRPGEHVEHRAGLQDAAGVEDHHRVAQRQGLRAVVRDQHDWGGPPRQPAAQLAAQALARRARRAPTAARPAAAAAACAPGRGPAPRAAAGRPTVAGGSALPARRVRTARPSRPRTFAARPPRSRKGRKRCWPPPCAAERARNPATGSPGRGAAAGREPGGPRRPTLPRRSE